MNLPCLPFVPARWFDNDGDILSGGKLYFWEAGTTTPKDTYSDYLGTTPNTNPVILDSSGHAVIFLGSGLYKVELRDANDVVLAAAIDGVGGATGSSTAIVVDTYDDLRAIDGNTATAVVVLGRTAAGDGGAGLFAWDTDETAADDGGAILAPDTLPVSGRWVRVRGEELLYQWWGPAAGSGDESGTLVTALDASAAREAPLVIEAGTVQIAANVTVPAGAVLNIPLGGKINASAPGYTITLSSGSWFYGSPDCFNDGISLETGFSGETVDYIDPDWWDMADDTDKLVRAGANLTDDQEIRISRRFTLTDSYTQPDFAILGFVGDGNLRWDTGNFTNVIKRWTGSADRMRFRLDDTTQGSITLANDQGIFYTPELFGGAQHIARAFQHGWVHLDKKYVDPGYIYTFSNDVWLRGFQPKNDASPANDSWVVSGWEPLEDGPSISVYQFRSLHCERVAICNPGTDASKGTRIATEYDMELTECSLISVNKTAPVALEGIHFKSIGGDLLLDGCVAENVAFEASSSGLVQDTQILGSFYGAPTSASLKAGTWSVRRSYVDTVEAACVFSALEDSQILSGGRCTVSRVSNCTVDIPVTLAAGTSRLLNSTFSEPVFGTVETDPLYINGSVVNAWNGVGEAYINASRVDGGGSRTPLTWLNAQTIDGVNGPATAYGREDLGSAYISTQSVVGWTNTAGAAPTSVVSNAFYWDGSGASEATRTMRRTITATDEKLLAAYGGTVKIEVTAGAGTNIGSALVTIGQHSNDGGGVAGAGDGDTLVLLLPVWPGADSTVTTYDITVTGDGGATLDEMTVKVTLQPCAPRTQQAWDTYWQWRAEGLVITSDRCSLWKETVIMNDRLNVWQNTSADTLDVDAPWTLLLPSKHVGVQKIDSATEYMIL